MIGKSQIYYIDSSKRVSGSTSDFTYLLNIPHEFTHCCVLQANIPMSYYLVRNGLNKLKVDEGGHITEITIPRGNYSALSFKTKLKKLLNDNCLWDYDIILPNSIEEPNIAKFTYSVSGNASQPSFIFESESLIYEQMGFDELSTNTFDGGVLQSKNCIKFIPEDTLMIHSSICSDANNDVLQEIYNGNNVQFSNITYHCANYEAYSKPIRDTRANIYNFRLCDESGNVINLNGLPMMITLLLWTKDTVMEMIREYIFHKISNDEAKKN